MAVPFIYLKDTKTDEGDNFNRSQAAPPNAELERLDDSGSSETTSETTTESTTETTSETTTESTTESTKEKPLSAKEKKALKKKKDAEKDMFDQTQQKYYLPQVGSYLIMEFEGKAYVVLVEKRYPLSVEVRVRFYESWDNGDPLTTRFKFEDGTRAHACVPARYVSSIIDEPVPCDKRGRVKLNDIDLSEYLDQMDYLAKRAERIRREEAAAKKVLRKTNSDYVRFVSMFCFQFVPYVLDIHYFFRYKSILSTLKFYIKILRVLIIQNVAFFLSFLL